jgi:nucleoside permease NupC
MIEQQLGFSLESFLRGIVGISTVLGVAYLMSYDRSIGNWWVADCLCSLSLLLPYCMSL